MPDTRNKFDFANAINSLEDINSWFQNEDIDLDEGLEKLKTGKSLIKQCRDRLKEVENEFVKINQEFKADSTSSQNQVPEEEEYEMMEDESNVKPRNSSSEPEEVPF